MYLCPLWPRNRGAAVRYLCSKSSPLYKESAVRIPITGVEGNSLAFAGFGGRDVESTTLLSRAMGPGTLVCGTLTAKISLCARASELGDEGLRA